MPGSIVLLASVLTSAACLSAYLVSRKRVLLFAFLAFLFYFFDVAWVLQDELMYPGLDAQMTSAYLMVRSYASILAGAGFLVSFWLVVCTVLGEKSRALMAVPGVVFMVASAVVLIAFPEGNVQRFTFYTLRALLLFWMLGFAAYRYRTMDDSMECERLRRYLRLYVALWALGVLVVAEDVLFFLVVDRSAEMLAMGVLAPYFWGLVVLCGLALPLAMAVAGLVLHRRGQGVKRGYGSPMAIGAAGALIGGCTLRFLILAAGIHADVVAETVMSLIG